MIFTPVVKTSHSINKMLLECAEEKKVDKKLLDFELISFRTFIKMKEDTSFKLLEDTSLLSIQNLLDSNFKIAQEYKIKIFHITHEPQDIKISLEMNRYKTKVNAIILKGSIFHKTPQLFSEIKKKIYYKKLRAGLLLDIFEEKLDTQLHKLLQIITYEKILQKNIKLNIATALHPITPIHSSIIKTFEQKQNNGSIISGVNKNELVLQYVKPKEGKNGRSCNAHFIHIKKAEKIILEPTINDTIFTKEDETSINYYAKETGYVLFQNNFLQISQHLTLEDGANFKTSANIKSGHKDKNVSVHIKHKKSHSEDAISSGVSIDVQKLDVDGSIGSNVQIKTKELNVDAQTHRNSKMEVSTEANVKLHRGNLKANDAYIDILETGKIIAHHSIHIKKMLGGQAIAPKIYVEEMLSNSTVIASKYIEIDKINGKENKLIINANKIESYHKDIEDLKSNIKIEEKNLQIQKDNIEQKHLEHQSKIERIKVFQQRIAKAKAQHKNPNKQDMIRLKIFKKESEKLKDEEIVSQTLEKKLDTLKIKLEKMYHIEFEAKIIHHQAYNGQTKVIFINTQTNEEYLCMPESLQEFIQLKKNNNNEVTLIC